MSGEHIINDEINTSRSREKNKNSKKKVDINILLNKVRADEKKEKCVTACQAKCQLDRTCLIVNRRSC